MHPINFHPVIKFYNQYNELGRTLGMTYELLEPGKVIYKMKVEKQILSSPAAAHGGALAAMMDAVLGVAALSMVCTDNKIVSTVELSTNYLRPAMIGDDLTGQAEMLFKGSRLLFFRGEIMNQNGDVIAVGKGTFNAYPIEKAIIAQSKR